MLPQAPAPRLEDLNDDELLRALCLESAFVPDPSAWCAKWRELSVRYRADATTPVELAGFWEEWRELMRPFNQAKR